MGGTRSGASRRKPDRRHDRRFRRRAAPHHGAALILALDGALGAFSCALDDGSSVRTRVVPGNRSLEAGLGAVADLLRDGGVALRDCDRVAVGVGPGGFTGLRIAVSFAKSLALGAGRPLVGISSFDAIEPEGLREPYATFVSGRRGVTCARWRVAGVTVTGCGPVAEVVARIIADAFDAAPLTTIGATEDVLAALAERARIVNALPRRTEAAAEAIALLARAAPLLVSPHAIRPDYGELPAVTVPAR